MFHEIRKVNEAWLEKKYQQLFDLQLLTNELNSKWGESISNCISHIDSLEYESKNEIFKNFNYLNQVSTLNNSIIEVYSGSDITDLSDCIQLNIETFEKEMLQFGNRCFGLSAFQKVDKIRIITDYSHFNTDQTLVKLDIRYENSPNLLKWIEGLENALDLIQTHPESRALVDNFVSSVVPLKSNASYLNQSFSSRKFPNVIFKNIEETDYLFAETLIHEADHQFIYLVELFNNFYTSNSNDKLYFSPWRDDPRPIDGILKGASAFARVCNFYRSILDKSKQASDQILIILSSRIVQSECALKTLKDSLLLSDFGLNYILEIESVLNQALNTIHSFPSGDDLLQLAKGELSANKANWEKINIA